MALLLAASIAGPAFAQAASFGDVFPVGNTRYGPVPGVAPLLRTNGRDFFLFWPGAENKIRATRLRDGETRLGRAVLDDVSRYFDVVWTGNHFLVFAARTKPDYTRMIVARKLDAEAQPIGDTFTVLDNAWLPRAAASDETLLMLYRPESSESYQGLVLNLEGQRKTGTPSMPSFAGQTALASNGSTFLVGASTHQELRTTLFDRNGQILSDRTTAMDLHQVVGVSVATDVTSYLVVPSGVWDVHAVPVEGNGAGGAPLPIAQLDRTPGASSGAFRSVAATWNGSGWTVAYSHSDGPISFAHLDASGRQVLAREELGPGTQNPTVAALGGRIKSAWSPPYNAKGHAAMVADLPLAAGESRAATYGAAQQLVIATASSDDATLIVWQERSDGLPNLRAGIRRIDGQWRERDLGPVGTNDRVLAASDGRGFVVAVSRPEVIEAFLLDGDARLLRTVTSTALSRIEGAVSNGRDYLIVGRGSGYGGGLKGALLKDGGATQQMVSLPTIGDHAGIASDGEGYLVTGYDIECFMGWCRPVGLRASRLRADFTRSDTAGDIVLADFKEQAITIEHLGTVWDGSQFVVAWTETRNPTPQDREHISTRIARIPSSPDGMAEITDLGKQPGSGGCISRTGSGTAIVGRATDSRGVPFNRVTHVRRDGGIAHSVDVDRGATLTARPLLAAHGDAVAYIASSVQNDAPHHGASHITMALTTSSVAPDRPEVTARIDENGVVAIAWSAPAGIVNGYRVEYRIADGSWIELEPWFRAGEQSTTMRVSKTVKQLAVRVRAFNDAGAGTYSGPAYVNAGRRRAVR